MYEYKVIRAPEDQGRSIMGRAKTSYAEALGYVLNEQGLDGWDFQRTEPGPDRHPLLIFRRGVKKLEDDLPEITLMHEPPRREKIEVQPRRARELLDEDRLAIDRLKNGRRRIVVDKAGKATAEVEQKANVADILSAQIARAKEQSRNNS